TLHFESELLVADVPGCTLIEEIGRGGHGIVYKAIQEGLNRTVAVKVLRKGVFASSEEVARFLAEAEAVARLKHSGIVGIHTVGNANGLPFYVMELMEGGSLSARCRGQPLPEIISTR